MTDQAPERPPLRVVGGSDARAERARRGSTYVCTWCALRFEGRADLDEHKMTRLMFEGEVVVFRLSTLV